MNLRAMYEKRNALLQEMENIVQKAVGETRAMTKEEKDSYDAKKAEVESLNTTIAAAEEERGLKNPPETEKQADKEAKEERAFVNYMRAELGVPVETRAGEQNITYGNNGAIIPVHIANRIIKTVQEISPIINKATIFRDKGELRIPVWGKANGEHDITVGYSDEFVELTADSGRFTSVSLTGYLMGALTLIGKSVITSASIDLVGFVVSEMALKFAQFWEKEALNGTEGKATGALSTTNTITAGAAAAVTADELITLQAKIPTAYQGGAAWYMHPDTFTAIRKLKDNNNRYMLQEDFSGAFPFRILGKPVYLSDNMPKMEAGSKAILYGDAKGLAIKITEGVNLQLLVEKYATMHAVGVVGWCEFDSKVMNHQMLASMTMGG